MKKSPQTKRFGNFEILGSLGKGGMGEVYLAQDLILGRKVAIKFLSGQIGRDEEFLKRFLQEAKASAILEHPNIVGVHSVGKAGDRPYIAMQYVAGKNLREILKARGKSFPLPVAVHFAIQIAQALDCAHQKGIMHRDIKPDNVMVNDQNQIKVMDFGLAKSFQDRHSITQTGCYLGTPEYSSPEQCETLDIDGRSDLYSLGVVLYEMLSGQVPHRADTPLQLFRKIVEEKPQDLRSLNSEIPPSLSAVVERLLEKDREKRYSSAREVIQDLHRCLPSTDTTGQHLSKTPTVSLTSGGTGETSGGTFIPEKEGEIEEAVTHISRKSPLLRMKKKKTLPLMGVLASLLVLAGIFYFYFAPSKKPLIPKAHPNTPQNPTYQGPPRLGLLDFSNKENQKDIAYLAVAISDIFFSKLKSLKDVEVLSRDYFKKLIKKIDKGAGEEDNEIRREKLSQKNFRFFIIGKFYRKGNKKVYLSLSIFDTREGEGKMESFYKEDLEEKIFELIDQLVDETTQYLTRKITPPSLLALAKGVPAASGIMGASKADNEADRSSASGLSKRKNDGPRPPLPSISSQSTGRKSETVVAMNLSQKLRSLQLSPQEDGKNEDTYSKEEKKKKARKKVMVPQFSSLTLEILRELQRDKPEKIQGKCSFLLARLLCQTKSDLEGGDKIEAQKKWKAFKELRKFSQMELRGGLKKTQEEIEKELK